MLYAHTRVYGEQRGGQQLGQVDITDENGLNLFQI